MFEEFASAEGLAAVPDLLEYSPVNTRVRGPLPTTAYVSVPSPLVSNSNSTVSPGSAAGILPPPVPGVTAPAWMASPAEARTTQSCREEL